ncbi:DGAT1/2-independent enzyme synthesizing storage lipids-like isoform X1 [Branchiostoma floridae x Branchiostoma belcheri]
MLVFALYTMVHLADGVTSSFCVTGGNCSAVTSGSPATASVHLAPESGPVCNSTTEQLFTNATILSWTESVTVTIETLHGVMEYLGMNNLDWETVFIYWILLPTAVLYILPWSMVGSLYVTAIIIHRFGEKHNLTDPFAGDVWLPARRMASAFWDIQAKFWHGHEIHGLEKLPKHGPGMLVYYHGTVPLDFYYVLAKINLVQNRPLWAVADHFMFNIPGWRFMLHTMGVTSGEHQHCVQVLKKGNLLGLAPGGLREALFGDENYRLIWRRRMGFAAVAKEAGVPIFPMFTQNCREAFRTPRMGKRFLEWVYEKTRMPVVGIYGGFPVKLRTYIGDPIYDPNLSAEELAKKTHRALEDMIAAHQKIPGNLLRALLERIPAFRSERND